MVNVTSDPVEKRGLCFFFRCVLLRSEEYLLSYGVISFSFLTKIVLMDDNTFPEVPSMSKYFIMFGLKFDEEKVQWMMSL